MGLCESRAEELAGAVSLAVPLLRRVTLALGEAVPEALPAPPALAVASPPLPPLRVAQSQGAAEGDAEGLPGCPGEALGCEELLGDALRLGEGEALGLPLGLRVASALALTLGEAVATEGVLLTEGRGEGEGGGELAGSWVPVALEHESGDWLGAWLSWGESVELGDGKAERELLGHEEPLGVALAQRVEVSVSESVALAWELALNDALAKAQDEGEGVTEADATESEGLEEGVGAAERLDKLLGVLEADGQGLCCGEGVHGGVREALGQRVPLGEVLVLRVGRREGEGAAQALGVALSDVLALGLGEEVCLADSAAVREGVVRGEGLPVWGGVAEVDWEGQCVAVPLCSGVRESEGEALAEALALALAQRVSEGEALGVLLASAEEGEPAGEAVSGCDCVASEVGEAA